MMTVTGPDGTRIRFNSATWVNRSIHGYTDLYTKHGGTWIAQVPNTWLIEAVAPCDVDRPADKRGVIASFKAMLRDRLSLGWSDACEVSEIKALLEKWNRQRNRWTR